jgi:hypothetical protein
MRIPVLPLILNEVSRASSAELTAYLQGASRDATFNRLHNTMRYAQRNRQWLEVLMAIHSRLGKRGWIYREGSRDVWVLESVGSVRRARPGKTSDSSQVMWLRGYFDAEGSIPRDLGARFYIQLVQKDRNDLLLAQDLLESLGITCGTLHNPSVAVDPDYWRFYVRALSIDRFVGTVSSWHPDKRAVFELRGAVSDPRRLA